MPKFFIILVLIIFCNELFSQDCRTEYESYETNLLKNKSIFRVVNEAPDYEYSRFTMDIVSSLELEACPTKVYMAFVIEPDSSLSNIFVCARMMCMTDSCSGKIAKINFEKDLKSALAKRKLPTAKHQVKK